ncbi:uncharacterized protein TNCV_3429631 [Trichonephila clavipes]|nr:uncharacterized protein TNCV_3429631 [Trichonephila clavipes]
MMATFMLEAIPVNAVFHTVCVIEQHSGLTPGVMIWRAISFHGRSNLLQVEGDLNSNRYVHEALQLEVAPFLQGIPGAIFQQDSVRHILQRLFETSVHSPTHATSSLACLFTGYVAC